MTVPCTAMLRADDSGRTAATGAPGWCSFAGRPRPHRAPGTRPARGAIRRDWAGWVTRAVAARGSAALRPRPECCGSAPGAAVALLGAVVRLAGCQQAVARRGRAALGWLAPTGQMNLAVAAIAVRTSIGVLTSLVVTGRRTTDAPHRGGAPAWCGGDVPDFGERRADPARGRPRTRTGRRGDPVARWSGKGAGRGSCVTVSCVTARRVREKACSRCPRAMVRSRCRTAGRCAAVYRRPAAGVLTA